MIRPSRVLACMLVFFAGPALCAAAVAAKKPPVPAMVADETAPAPMVIGIELTDNSAQSHLVLELSDPVDFRSFLLTNPNRVVVEMPEVLWRPGTTPAPSGRGIVKNYRFGQFRKNDSRLVVELNRPVKIASAAMLAPGDGAGFRLVINLTPTTASDFAANAGWPTPAEFAPNKNTLLADQTRKDSRPLIIIDPGHGGMDPGTHGESGLLEKNIALSVARQLRERLEQSGHYRVKLTRDADVFIPLRDRVEIARAAHGDLFVSLHADSNEYREIRGASVYTLSRGASDREAASLADKENLAGVALGLEPADTTAVADSILTDMGQREITNLSARFAETIIAALPPATDVHKPLPHRSANFAVLKAPDIPSVLIELGYLTNTDDESEMATQSWRMRVAGAIANAIDLHFSQAQVIKAPMAEAKAAPLSLSGHIRGVRTMPEQPAQELTQ